MPSPWGVRPTGRVPRNSACPVSLSRMLFFGQTPGRCPDACRIMRMYFPQLLSNHLLFYNAL